MQDLSGPEPAASKLKVFLSYSRKDAAFAQELLTSLELLGFDAYLDKDDIAPGEPWEERLANLIRQALINLAKSGAAIVAISQDLDEIFEISDRIAVISRGELSQAYPADEISLEEIGMLMAGKAERKPAAGADHAH